MCVCLQVITKNNDIEQVLEYLLQKSHKSYRYIINYLVLSHDRSIIGF